MACSYNYNYLEWNVILALEVIRTITSKSKILIETYKRYDCTDSADHVYEGIINSLSQFVTMGFKQLRKTERLDAAWDFYSKRPTLKDELEEGI